MEFVPYPKTPRLKRSVIVTEKIDGTNAQIVIRLGDASDLEFGVDTQIEIAGVSHLLRAGSRTRWISPGKNTDNFGFAAWVYQNAPELAKLGEGQHFGEWYGQGIQRGYGLTERRFALFNTARWGAHNPNTPACCEVVPVLTTCGLYETGTGSLQDILSELRANGSVAPGATTGFSAEGVIVYHSASKQNFKVLLDNDDVPKGTVTP